MPNYCENKLTVTGTISQLNSFKYLFYNEEGIDFNKIVPEPKRMKDCPKEYIIPKDKRYKKDEYNTRPWFDWYNFHIDKWGTKCEACSPCDHLSFQGGYSFEAPATLEIYFDSAWSPPLPIIQALIDKCPVLDITLYYYEPGMDFAGYYDKTGDNPADDTRQFAIDYMGYSKEDFEDDEDDEDDYEEDEDV